jgi:hypothetical protein
MNIGDRIVCIDNSSYAYYEGANNVNLTIGKVYIVNNISVVGRGFDDKVDLIFVIDDFGKKDFFTEKRFVSLCKIRKDKLRKLQLL